MAIPRGRGPAGREGSQVGEGSRPGGCFEVQMSVQGVYGGVPWVRPMGLREKAGVAEGGLMPSQ